MRNSTQKNKNKNNFLRVFPVTSDSHGTEVIRQLSACGLIASGGTEVTRSNIISRGKARAKNLNNFLVTFHPGVPDPRGVFNMGSDILLMSAPPSQSQQQQVVSTGYYFSIVLACGAVAIEWTSKTFA